MDIEEKIKQKILEGLSDLVIAKQLNCSLIDINNIRKSTTDEIKIQAVQNRLAIRQLIRDKFPQSLDKALQIMEMEFEDLAQGSIARSQNIQFLKLQLDSARVVLSLASHVIGEDLLTMYNEKITEKKQNIRMTYRQEILADGSTRLTATKDSDNQKEGDEITIKLEDVL